MNPSTTPRLSRSRKNVAYLAALITLGSVCAYGQAASDTAPSPLDPAAEKARIEQQKKLDAEVAKASAEASSKGDTIELSPFVVESDKDDGYMASNTMGSRLNTKLDDVAASISVVTKQQLSDFGLIDINDIFALEANTEGTGNFTANSNTGNAQQEVDDVAINRQSANRVRGLGAANVSYGNFAASGNVPIDTYNVDAVEISRGPNSNVFGTGDGSGVVNLVPASANLTKEFTKTSLMGTDRGTMRATIDINRPILKNILGVRILGSATNEKFLRKPSYDDTRRLTAGFTLRPHRNTVLRVSYENFEEKYSRPNSYTPRERMTSWIAAGRPSWDPTTNTFNYYNADGSVARTGTVSKAAVTTPVAVTAWNYLYNMTGSNTPTTDQVYVNTMGTSRVRPTMAIDQGSISYYQPSYIGVAPHAFSLTGTSSTAINLNSAELAAVSYTSYWGVPAEYRTATAIGFNAFPGTSDKNFYNWEKDSLTGVNRGRKTARFLRAELEQYFLQTEHHTIAAQFGAFKEDILDYNSSFVGGGRDGVPYDITPDVNLKLLDGSVNPNYGKPYITALAPKTLVSPIDTLTKKVNAVYQLDLTKSKNKWLKAIGRQRFLGYYEHNRRESPTQALYYNDQIVSTFDGKWFSSNGGQTNQSTTTVYGPSGSIDPWMQGGYWPAQGTRQANTTYGIRANAQAIWNARYYLGDTSGNVDYGTMALNTNNVSFRRYGNNTGYTKANGVFLPGTPTSNARNNYIYANTADPFAWSTENVELGTVLIGAGGNMQKSVYTTKGGVYQGFFWGDRIVPTIGVRQDTLRVKNWSGFGAITDIDPVTGFYRDTSPAFEYDSNPYRVFNNTTGATSARGTTRTKGIVVKPFKWLHLSYNQSNSMKPEEYQIDFQANPLPNPYGETKDYGVRFFLFDDKLSLRLAKYETVNIGARQATNSVYSRILLMDFDTGTTDSSRHDLVDWYAGELALSKGLTTEAWQALPNTDPLYAQIYTQTYASIGMTPEYITAIQQAGIRMTTDEKSEGYEAEIFYRPNRWFSVKMTGSSTEAITTGISKSFQDYRDARWSTWTTIESPNKANYLASTTMTPAEKDAAIYYWKHVFSDGGGSDVRTYYYNVIENGVKLNFALQGKPKPQVRKYKFNIMPAIKLSGLTSNRHLRNVSLGGSMRWEDKGAIGFYGQAPTVVDGSTSTATFVQGYDATRPIYDKAHAYFDFWTNYSFRLFRDRIRGTVQLNVQNVFEKGGLRAFNARPDGTVYGYRIIDPREFKLTVSFDL